jgi:hypothetical protein
MSGCGEVRTLLGVYVLGAIDPAGRAEVEAHLTRCPDCRDELAGLACLPALLGRADEAQVQQAPAPSEESLDALLAAAAATRRRRVRRWMPQTAAALVILVMGVLGGMAAGGDASRPVPPPPPEPIAEQVSATDPRTHVTAQLGIDGKAWGTAVAVRLKGVPLGTRCRLMAVGKDGRRDIAAGWQVVYRGYADFQGSTMIARNELRAFEIDTVDGRHLLTIASPPPG